MLKHTKGNLLDLAEKGEFDVIVHGCNCFTTMGGGIAREIAERFPEAKAVDYFESLHGDYNKLGTWTETMKLPFKIINAYTQYETSRGEDVFEYTAFALILQKLVHAYGDLRIGLPYIGMGLAGGDKTRIITLLENFAIKVSAKGGTVTLVEFV
jgi:O-acetyl-ADP-ribose deacetylase (regulator of RNase III)